MTPRRRWRRRCPRPGHSQRPGPTPRTCGPRRRRSRSTARPWRRPAVTSPAPSATHGARGTWRAPRTTSCAAARPGSSAWPPGPPETSTRRWPRSPRRSAACTPPGTSSTSWTARSCSADMWIAAGPTEPCAPAVRAGAADRDRGTASPTRGPPPTCTSAWPSSTCELDDLAGAEDAPGDGTGPGRARLHHREPAPVVRGHGAGARRAQATTPARDAAARPGSGAVPARLLPRRTPDRAR